MNEQAEYLYLGDRLTDLRLKNRYGNAVRDERGKCIRGRNGSMLVELLVPQPHFILEGQITSGLVYVRERHVVLGRRLRRQYPSNPISKIHL